MNDEIHKQQQALSNDISALAEHARALLAATGDVAGEKVVEARKRLAAALESGKEVYERVRERTVERARALDETVRENPYQALGIAFGLGALIGILAARQRSRSD